MPTPSPPMCTTRLGSIDVLANTGAYGMHPAPTIVPTVPTNPRRVIGSIVLLTNQFRRVGRFGRRVVLRATAETIRDVEIAFRVDRDLMRLPELSGLHPVRAPEIQPLAVLVELQQARVRAVHDPHGAIAAQHDVIRLSKTRPDVDRLA